MEKRERWNIIGAKNMIVKETINYCPDCFLNWNPKEIICKAFGVENSEYIQTVEIKCGLCGQTHLVEKVIE